MLRIKHTESSSTSYVLNYPSQLLTLLTTSFQLAVNYATSFWSEESAEDAYQAYGITSIPLQKLQQSYSPVIAKSIHEINYADKAYWAALFGDSVEVLKDNIFLLSAAALQQQLVEWQGLIGKLTLSPRIYEQELRDLQQYVQQHPDKAFVKETVFDEVLNDFHQALKKQAAFTLENLQADVYYYLNALLQEQVTVNALPSAIAFYQGLVSLKIYEKVKLRVEVFIKKYFTTHQHKAGYPLCYLLTEDKIKCLRDDLHKLFMYAREQLSVEDLAELCNTKGTKSYNAISLTSKVSLLNSEKENVVFSSIIYQFIQGIKTVGQYIIQHPLQALTIGLAAQTSAAAAYSSLTKCTQFDGNLTFGKEFQVNTYTTNEQTYPAVASLGESDFAVVWQSNGQDGSGSGIYGQRLDINGIKVGSEFQVNTYTTSEQKYPSIARLGNGHFVVVWLRLSQYGFESEVYGQSFDVNGIKVGSEFQINSYTVDNQINPSIASLDNNYFVTVWQSGGQDGSGFGIYGQRFTVNGTKVGNEFQINTYTRNDQRNPSVASLREGHFAVVWQSYGQDGFQDGIYGQRFNVNGVKIGREFQINTYTTEDQIIPSIASLGDGNFVVVWHSDWQDGFNSGIYGQRFDVDGRKAGSEFQINSYIYGGQWIPEVANIGNGNFVVVWMSMGQDGSESGIYGQRFDGNGTKVGSEFQINTYTNLNQRSPSVARLSEGHFVTVWISYGQDGSKDGVYGRIITTCSQNTPNDDQSLTSTAKDDNSILLWTAIAAGTAASISALGVFAYKKYQQHRQRVLVHASDSGNSDDLLESAEVSELINMTPGGYRGTNMARRLIP